MRVKEEESTKQDLKPIPHVCFLFFTKLKGMI